MRECTKGILSIYFKSVNNEQKKIKKIRYKEDFHINFNMWMSWHGTYIIFQLSNTIGDYQNSMHPFKIFPGINI